MKQSLSPENLDISVRSAGYTHPIVSDCHLKIPEGHFCCILGANGSGKSTFLKAILGLLPLSDSDVFTGGKPFFSISLKERARLISFMFQKLEIVFPFTVEELVSLGRYPHSGLMSELSSHDEDAIRESLALTGTDSLRGRRINELSGGEYQRVLLAKTLAQKTPVMLLDEPTAHMDLGYQVQTYELLKKLSRQEKKTILIVCHDINLASEYADSIVMFSSGRICATGKPEDTLTTQNLQHMSDSSCLTVQPSPVTSRPHVYIRPTHSL